MNDYPAPLDLKKVRVYPLAERNSLSEIAKLLVDPRGRLRPASLPFSSPLPLVRER